ncbi:MAG: hypothetical protein IT357_10555 [Gemmatimonadaceae bacterium]|nr:hypothetical protein [Gemmatimonadaceae bacterium]
MTSTTRSPISLSAARNLPRSTQYALALLFAHMLFSAVIATWFVVGMDTRFLAGRLLMIVPFLSSLVVFVGLLRRAPWAWWVSVFFGGYTVLQRASWLVIGIGHLWSGTWGSTRGILVWYLVTGLIALLFVRLLATRESRDAFRVVVT